MPHPLRQPDCHATCFPTCPALGACLAGGWHRCTKPRVRRSNCSFVVTLVWLLLLPFETAHELAELFVEVPVTMAVFMVPVGAILCRRVGDVQPPALFLSATKR